MSKNDNTQPDLSNIATNIEIDHEKCMKNALAQETLAVRKFSSVLGVAVKTYQNLVKIANQTTAIEQPSKETNSNFTALKAYVEMNIEAIKERDVPGKLITLVEAGVKEVALIREECIKTYNVAFDALLSELDLENIAPESSELPGQIASDEE